MNYIIYNNKKAYEIPGALNYYLLEGDSERDWNILSFKVDKISGDRNPMKNKEVALKLAQILKEKGHYDRKETCIYCGKTFNLFMIRRWHNEKCKLKNK